MARKKTARQTANQQEYNRLRRNLLARMRYREKQGFKVDYTTKPPTNKAPTKKDIEKLGKYQVGINKYGEVIAQRPTRQATTINTDFKTALKSQQFTKNDIDYFPTPQRQKEIELDYVGMIFGALQDIHEKAQSISYEDYDHFIGEQKILEIMTVYEDIFESLCDVVDNEISKHGEAKVNAYYKDRFTEISLEIAEFTKAVLSDDDKILSWGNTIKDILIVP